MCNIISYHRSHTCNRYTGHHRELFLPPAITIIITEHCDIVLIMITHADDMLPMSADSPRGFLIFATVIFTENSSFACASLWSECLPHYCFAHCCSIQVTLVPFVPHYDQNVFPIIVLPIIALYRLLWSLLCLIMIRMSSPLLFCPLLVYTGYFGPFFEAFFFFLPSRLASLSSRFALPSFATSSVSFSWAPSLFPSVANPLSFSSSTSSPVSSTCPGSGLVSLSRYPLSSERADAGLDTGDGDLYGGGGGHGSSSVCGVVPGGGAPLPLITAIFILWGWSL